MLILLHRRDTPSDDAFVTDGPIGKFQEVIALISEVIELIGILISMLHFGRMAFYALFKVPQSVLRSLIRTRYL